MKKIESDAECDYLFTSGRGRSLNELRDARWRAGAALGRYECAAGTEPAADNCVDDRRAVLRPDVPGALPDIFAQINDSIRNQYVLTYRPTNKKNDGTYRKVKVLLVDNEGKPLKMQDEKQKPVKYTCDLARWV